MNIITIKRSKITTSSMRFRNSGAKGLFKRIFNYTLGNFDPWDCLAEVRTQHHCRNLSIAWNRYWSHNNDRILKVDPAAKTVGEHTVVKHLQQDMENIRVSFFNFIQQDDGVGAAPYLLGKLSAFFISYITRRRTDQS
jgi:hypothetical protein